LLIGALLVLHRAESAALRGLAAYLVLENVSGWFLSLPGGWLHDQGITWLLLALDVTGFRPSLRAPDPRQRRPAAGRPPSRPLHRRA
jgi:hypothetical protein